MCTAKSQKKLVRFRTYIFFRIFASTAPMEYQKVYFLYLLYEAYGSQVTRRLF
jgi:hypothetical protein